MPVMYGGKIFVITQSEQLPRVNRKEVNSDNNRKHETERDGKQLQLHVMIKMYSAAVSYLLQ